MWNNARFINLVANGLTVLALTALLLGGLAWLGQRPEFTLSRITVEPMDGESLGRVTPASLTTTVAGRLQGNFFTADLENLRRLFENTPWVKQAMVRRVWPDGVEVALREYEPLGLWNDNQILDVDGQPFTANQAEAEDAEGGPLPQLGGPDGSGKLVRRRLTELTDWLAPIGRVPVSLTLSPRHAWKAELDNGMVLDMGRDPATDPIVGQSQPDARHQVPVQTRVQRFVEALPAIEQNVGRPVIYADLRYPNGFALRLGPAPAPAKPSSSTTRP